MWFELEIKYMYSTIKYMYVASAQHEVRPHQHLQVEKAPTHYFYMITNHLYRDITGKC